MSGAQAAERDKRNSEIETDPLHAELRLQFCGIHRWLEETSGHAAGGTRRALFRGFRKYVEMDPDQRIEYQNLLRNAGAWGWISQVVRYFQFPRRRNCKI